MHERNPWVGGWLATCALLVGAMIWLGGITRLTHSGLSIVEWKPVTGIVPPLNAFEWQQEFAKYRGSPEFLLVNHHLDLRGFQSIYWIEYAHRLLGRALGAVFLLPLIGLTLARRLSTRRTLILGGCLVLGGLQAVVGWYMVQSGLVSEPRVSHYRLTAHFVLAVILFALLLWQALDELLTESQAPLPSKQALRWTIAAGGLVVATMIWGALMAGLTAGPMFPTFPTMNGSWVPAAALGKLEPLWRDGTDNPATVHFLHRLLATFTLGAILTLWWQLRRSPGRLQLARHGLLVAVVVQVALGAFTVLDGSRIAWASLHQANALTLVGWIVFLLQGHRTSRRSVGAAPAGHQFR